MDDFPWEADKFFSSGGQVPRCLDVHKIGISTLHRLARRLSICGIVALVLCAGGARAEESELRWRWDLFLEEMVSYDSNVFRLSDKLRDRREEDRPGDRISGRFDNMDSESDVVVSSNLVLVSKVTGFGDRRIRIIPSIRNDYFTHNDSKSHMTFGLSVDRDLRSGTNISLDLAYELNVFAKNYLLDATDLTGRVSASERVYDRGEYDEAFVGITYETRLWKRKKKTESFLDARRIEGFAELGYARRDYDRPFFNRDRNVVNLALGVTTKFSKRWKLDLGYEFEFVSTGNGKEVLVRDEPDFGIDFNGNGNTEDLKRRTEQRVDRSRMDHSVDLRLRYDITKRWETWAAYRFGFQDYFSEERFDTHRDRKDLGHSVQAGVGWEIDSRWSLELEGRWLEEEANKRAFGDDEERETDYERFIVSFGVIVRFF